MVLLKREITGQFAVRCIVIAVTIGFFSIASAQKIQNPNGGKAVSDTKKTEKTLVNNKYVFPDDYTILDEDGKKVLANDEMFKATMESARDKYNQALKAVEKGETSKGAKLFEDAVKELNNLLNYPGIEQNEEYYDLTQSIFDDYETYIQNIDDLDENTPLFIIRDKFYKDLENLNSAKNIKPLTEKNDVAVTKDNETFIQDSTLIPLPLNESVQKSINFLTTTKYKKFVTKWLERSTKWLPMMRRIAAQQGMPEEIIYLSIIESALDPNNISRASAVGLWQFMRPTGQDYNLNVNPSLWTDERRDPEKSTIAAMRYIKDLYNMFNDWHLALAAYNCGQGRVAKAIRKSGLKSPNYWALRPHLPVDTRYYVAQYISAALIAMHPERYGFRLDTIKFQEEYKYDIYPLKEPVNLDALGSCIDAPSSIIKEYNPELVKSCTPPDLQVYYLKIPYGSLNKFSQKFATLSEEQKRPWIVHIVNKGETVKSLATKYQISPEEVLAINSFSNAKSKINKGSEVRLPISKDEYEKLTAQNEAEKKDYPTDGTEDVFHIVRSGETMYSIARKYGISVSELKSLNNISEKTEKLSAGQQLVIALKDGSESTLASSSNDEEVSTPKKLKAAPREVIVKHKVKKGESIAQIADDYGVSVASIKELNKVKKGKLKAGTTLKIQTTDLAVRSTSKSHSSNESSSKKLVVHKVKKGESLGMIAAQYGITESELKSLNSGAIKGHSVFAGTRLKVYKYEDNKGSARSSSNKVAKLPNYYKIQKGETMATISRKFGISVEQLKKRNKGIAEGRLQVGQKLRLQ